jgi:hypothetical protein
MARAICRGACSNRQKFEFQAALEALFHNAVVYRSTRKEFTQGSMRQMP